MFNSKRGAIGEAILFLIAIAITIGIIFVSTQMKTGQYPQPTTLAPIQPELPEIPGLPGSPEPTLTPQQAEDLWTIITLENVQKACLSEAKKAAGSNAWAVTSCSCDESVSTDEKTYACVVTAIDGKHSLNADCIKSRQQCIVTSERGTVSLSFQEVQRIAQTT
ncbi:MAG TPA: hypothetical protein VGQ00_04455 [Candidatus Norongarragalinales archaeon]|jgi:hypothetical protein|nr:hypothetical protein [Candidatus Norongarragalinales archaeon]